MTPRLLVHALMVAAWLWGARPAPAAAGEPQAAASTPQAHPTAAAPRAGQALQRPSTPPDCTPAAIQDVVLSGPVPVDAIRVVMADGSPVTAAARVRVDSGAFDRVLFVRGGMSQQLLFNPAIRSAEFRVSIFPVLAARRSACIARIELLRQGARVATVKP